MKITQKTSSKKKTLILTSLVLVILVAAGGVYYMTTRKANEPINYNPATEEEKTDGDATKKKTIESQPTTPQTESQKTTPDTNANGAAVQPPQSQAVPIRITAKSQNGNLYQIRTLIDGVFASGACTLTATKAQQKVTKTASLQPLAQSSTCQGFDIPTSELSPGTWNIQLSFTSDQSTGSTSDVIEVK